MDVRQRETTVIGGAQNAGPRIEDLHRLDARPHLQLQVVDHRDSELLEQGFKGGWLAEHQPLDGAEALFAFALHQVCGQREGRATEADQRGAAVEFRSQQAHGVGDEGEHLAGGLRPQGLDLRARSDRLGDLGTGVEGHVDAERIERQHDVREQDGGIEREAPQRLQRDLGRQFRGAAQLEEADAAAQFAILREVAAGLAHDPDGGAIHGLPPAGAQETVVHRVMSCKVAWAASTVWAMIA